MADCIFCRIAGGETDTELLYEDEQVVAFADRSPKAPVHLLIVPRKHIPSVADMAADDEALAGHLIQVAKELAVDSGIAENGYRLVVNVRAHGGQTVDHLHMHVLGGHRLGGVI